MDGPKDDASTFAIAQNQRGDIAGFNAVRTALAGGQSIVDVAITAGKAISDLLIEMKAKVVQANQAGLDAASRTALNNDFAALRDQITTIVQTAAFNGTNIITSGATSLQVLSTVDGSTISISAQSLDTTTLAISAADLTTSASAALALTAIDTAIQSVSERLANLGSSAKRIEVQSDFTVKLVDILKVGVGNLVDANLAEESATPGAPGKTGPRRAGAGHRQPEPADHPPALPELARSSPRAEEAAQRPSRSGTAPAPAPLS